VAKKYCQKFQPPEQDAHRGVTFSPKVGVPLALRPPFFPLASLPFPLEVGALNRTKESGECFKLPYRGPERSPGRPCISAQFQLKRGPLVSGRRGGAGMRVHPHQRCYEISRVRHVCSHECWSSCSCV